MTQLFGYPLGWIMWLLYQVVRNYGIALLLFTILAKAALFPLSIKQQKSSAKMAVFSPKMQEIQKKYANNKQKQQEEMMKLYEEHGYNPMSGCLPMLIQFPILFGIIDVVYNPLKHILRIPTDTIQKAADILAQHVDKINTTQQELQILAAVQNPDQVGWFSEMGTEFIEKVSNFNYTFFGIYLGNTPTWGWNLLLLVPILSGVTALLTSLITMKMSATPQQSGGMMKGMMIFMPLMSFWIAFSVPAGVGIYWIISNVLACVQSVLLFKLYNPEKYKAEYEAQLLAEQQRKKEEREKRRQQKLKKGEPLTDDDLEEDEKKKPSAKDAVKDPNRDPKKEYLSAKEANRRRLAEARRLDAEKYGEEYKEVTDNDLL